MTSSTPAQLQRIERTIRDHPLLEAVLAAWSELRLPECWLAGGAIAQAYWNEIFGYAPDHAIADIDLVYFDGEDTSEEAETIQSARVRGILADIPVRIDVKNEARVHLWYAAKFGYPIPPYTSAVQAIATFPTTSTAIGVRPQSGGLDIFAPYGLADLLKPVVRPNKVQITQEIYEAKTARWRTHWPSLEIVDWDDCL